MKSVPGLLLACILLFQACITPIKAFQTTGTSRVANSLIQSKLRLSSLDNDAEHAKDSMMTRQQMLMTALIGSAGLFGGSLSALATDVPSSIAPCKKPATGGPANCLSTASVRQVDLYATPWTWNDGISVDEVVGRLKGAIEADPNLSIVEQVGNEYLKVRGTRNFSTDEAEFLINASDRFITFRSQQVDGPDSVSDFGQQRKRLEEVRKRTKVLSNMGAEFNSADSGPREGAIGQLKAFWGLQSGGGYESVLLDN